MIMMMMMTVMTKHLTFDGPRRKKKRRRTIRPVPPVRADDLYDLMYDFPVFSAPTIPTFFRLNNTISFPVITNTHVVITN